MMYLLKKYYVLCILVFGTIFNVISQPTVKMTHHLVWNFDNEMVMKFHVFSDTNLVDTLNIHFGLENNTTDSAYMLEKTKVVSDFVTLPLPHTGYYTSFIDTFSFFHPTYMHTVTVNDSSSFRLNKTGLLTHASFEFTGQTTEFFNTHLYVGGYYYDSLTNNMVYGGYYGGGGGYPFSLNEELNPKLLEADYIGVEVDFIRVLPCPYPISLYYGDTNIIGVNATGFNALPYESYEVFSTPFDHVYYPVSTLIPTDSFESFGFGRSNMIDNLKIYPVYNKYICSQDSIEIDSIMVNAEGLYMDTLYTTLGTDSVFAINLIHTDTLFTTDTLAYAICLGDSLYLNGESFWLTSGFHSLNLMSSGGCDSVVNINLDLRNEVISSTISNVDNVLSVDAPDSSYTYQWINVTTNQPILGEVFQSYEPTDNGEYAVIITNGVCSGVSNTVSTFIGLDELEIELTISPNPFSDLILVQFTESQPKIDIQITDIQSRVVFEQTYSEMENIEIDGKSFINGIYYLTIKNELTEITKPIIRLK